MDQPPPEPNYRNIIKQSLKVQQFLAEDPTRSYLHASRHFKVSRPRISQLMKIADNLPPNFLAKMRDCQDSKMLKRFTGKTLLKIAALNSPKSRQETIDRLMEL